ncbi:MAG: PAS domain S-box protein [bacterium]|nr:PAS domain S-box protein [bacterium]
MNTAQFFDLSYDLFCIAGLDGYFKRVNAAWVHTLGYSESELLGKPFLDFVHPEDIEKTASEFEKLLNGERSHGFRNRYIDKQDGVHTFEWITLSHFESGIIYATARDITRQLETENEIKRHQEELDQLVAQRTADLMESNSRLLTEIAERKRIQEENEKLIAELREALSRVETLSGLIPICASCKKIRDDQGYWSHVEQYIQAHSSAIFSHGMCPDCAEQYYGDAAIESSA